MKVAVWGRELEDSYLKFVCQIGADAVDGLPIPNEPGKGYFDLDETLKIKRKIAAWGMEINRVSLPYLSEAYVDDGDGAEEELENCCQSLRVLGEAKLPLGRVGFARDVYPWMRKDHRAVHRGGLRVPRGGRQGRHGSALRRGAGALLGPGSATPTASSSRSPRSTGCG